MGGYKKQLRDNEKPIENGEESSQDDNDVISVDDNVAKYSKEGINEHGSSNDSFQPTTTTDTTNNDNNNNSNGTVIQESESVIVDEEEEEVEADNVHSAVKMTIQAYLDVLTNPLRIPRPMEISLEGIAMIIDYQYYTGRAGGMDDRTGSGRFTTARAEKDGSAIPPPSLLHTILQSIATVSESTIETIQSNVIKTLTTIVNSPACYIHEGSLLLAMRSSFHVYLITKVPTCKQSAKHALVNMLHSIFIKMEAQDALLRNNSSCSSIASSVATTERDNNNNTNNNTGSGKSSSSPKNVKRYKSCDDIEGQDHNSRIKNNNNNTDDTIINRKRTASDEGRTAQLQQQQQQAAASGNSSTTTTTTTFASQYHADAYFLFRALCKLSSKELLAENTGDDTERKMGNSIMTSLNNMLTSPADPTELHSKILALELILSSIEMCGEAFTNGDKFLYLVQHYLSGSLLKNCVSNHTQVAFLSQRIFLVLVYKFKDHLKQDIEVFMSNVFFRVLESQNSSFKQKALVLESLRTLCKDPVVLTQIFLNYDCDFDAMSLYKDIVQMLTKLGGKATSAPSSSLSKKDAEREFELSLAAIECLVNIAKTFLRALGLPGGEEGDDSDETAGSRIRAMLNLDQALLAAGTTATSSTAETVLSDDASTHSIQPIGQQTPSVAATNDTTSSSSSSDMAGQIVDAFDRKRNAEQNFEIGCVKFTLSLKSGLLYFIDHGFVTLDARDVAQFFIANKDKLDKTQMGEALGREPYAAFVKDESVEPDKGGTGFWFRILHYYAELLDFTGLRFDEAIRLFLSGFRLPGEAQKIDRIMEKFAERFTSLNPDVFPSSDTAFILAFSVIMLNTDLHNPNIKPEKRMTVDSFLRNNRGIGENGSDLPEDFLRGIFDRIRDSPFSLKEDDAARERVGGQKQIFDTSLLFDSTPFGASAEDRKRENFKKERDEMMAETERLIKRRSVGKGAALKGSTIATSAIAPAEVVKPMFDITWGPMLGILSQVLECSDDERTVAVCLNGFVFAVRLAANSSMSLARDTFVSSLAKFTYLGSIKEMKRKNVESIRTLLSMAVADGEFLGESWGPVLQCISQLARLRLTASGLDSDESFLLVEEPKKLAAKTSSGMFSPPSKVEIAREAEENNAKAVLEAVQEVLIDKVFSSTVSLSAKSLAHFIEQIISVSAAEIGGNSKSGITGVESLKKDSSHGPSIFMLQRLVDVADHNMNVRPRLVWAQIWELMSDFFVKNACHSNAMVSFFAIDSLKQLSLKFLEKPELSEFNFQSSFLRPFQIVIENKNSRDDIRELVLSCADNIIRAKSQNLRSGWKVLFAVLTASARDPNIKIETLGLTILQRLLDEHLDDVGSLVDKHAAEVPLDQMSSVDRRNRNANADDFVCLCKASLSFLKFDESGLVRPIGLTLRAFCHTAIYADLLGSSRVLPPVSGAQSADSSAQGYTYDGLSEAESLEMVPWRPLLEGLAGGVVSTAVTSESGVGCFIQRASILALRSIFFRHGHLFSVAQLSAVLSQTIMPAIQLAAENDKSAVASIISESPSISNIDFLVDALPLPPAPDDLDLLQFEAQNNTLPRSLGPAELMLEASFTDLRHGGDGDLRKAYKLAKKSPSDSVRVAELPFPDSWLATTASMALGLLTDITSEFVVKLGPEGREKLWPLIAEQYRRWCLGNPRTPASSSGIADFSWSSCEALVRISCTEINRLLKRLASDHNFVTLAEDEKTSWSCLIVSLCAELLAESVSMEESYRVELLRWRNRKVGTRSNPSDSSDDPRKSEDVEDLNLHTQYGRGKLVNSKTHTFSDIKTGSSAMIMMDQIALDFGATLFRPSSSLSETTGFTPKRVSESVRTSSNDLNESYSLRLVPELKIRCVAAHCLQQTLIDLSEGYILSASKDVLSTLLYSLENSRLTSASAVRDDDISTAFQESLLEEWGDGIAAPDETTESSARFSLLHGSAVFFLTQEASATKACIHILSRLYLSTHFGCHWNRINFAESHLLKTIQEVHDKFLESEVSEGHMVDPNMWRSSHEIGVKVAMYCTVFASVVVENLKIIRSISEDRFEMHKHIYFPMLCGLIQVQSEEIRELVQEILATRVAPMLGVRVNHRPRQRVSRT